MRLSAPAALFACAIAFSASALAQTAQDTAGTSASRESDKESPVSESPMPVESRLTKNWGGARSRLSDAGIDLAVIYKLEHAAVFSGGLARSQATIGNLDFRAGFDLDKLAGWRGGSAFLYMLGDHGGDPSKGVGDIQVTSNIEAPVDTAKVYELWLQQLGFENRVSLLAGLHDLNSEFYVTESTNLFFNSSFGVGKDLSQTGTNGPSIFPTTSLALRLRTEPAPEFYLQLGLFDAHAGDVAEPHGTQIRFRADEGLLLIGEAAILRGRSGGGALRGKYGVGFWTYTIPTSHLVTGAPVVNRGAYVLTEQELATGWSAFVRYGVATTEANRVGSCLGAGTVWTGLLPGRARDRFGIAVARVGTGGEYNDVRRSAGASVAGSETAIEASYRLELIPGIALQPDFQYVIHPGALDSVENAAVGALRAEISL